MWLILTGKVHCKVVFFNSIFKLVTILEIAAHKGLFGFTLTSLRKKKGLFLVLIYCTNHAPDKILKLHWGQPHLETHQLKTLTL